jgi:hypothetical protein
MLARGYNTGGLIGGLSDAINGNDNMTVRALRARGLDPDTASVVAGNPTLLQQYLTPTQGATFGVVGEDHLGRKIYGWINPRTQTATPANVSGSGANGAPGGINTSLTGEAYLAQLDPPTQRMVKSIVEGRQPFPGAQALRTPYWQGMLEHAGQYDPTFDATTWHARQRTATGFSPDGMEGRNLTALATAVNHMAEARNAIDALGNYTTLPGLNAPRNIVRGQFDPEYQRARTRFDTARQIAVTEVAKALRGSGVMTEHELREWEAKFNADSSPEVMREALATAARLLAGRADPLMAQYNAAMGTNRTLGDFFGAVNHPEAAANLTLLLGGHSAPPSQSGGTGRIRTYNPATGRLE